MIYLKVISIIVLVLSLFFWGISHGSGHKIPIENDLLFAFISGASLLVFFIAKRKKVA